jgi:hypothetical protein
MKAPDLSFTRPNGAVSLEASLPTFPTAERNLATLDAISAYRVESEQAVKRWVAATLGPVESSREEYAQGIAYQAAKRDVGRPLYSPEFRVLSECVRDFLVCRATLRKQAAEGAR